MKTIIVSIPAPNAKMRLKFVKKFNEYPSLSSTINVIKNDNTIEKLAISACLIPMNNELIIKTRRMDCHAVLPNET